MSLPLQSALFDSAPATASDAAASPAPLGVPALPAQLRRIELGQGAWVDLHPGWIHNPDAVFDRLLAQVPWVAERVPMYERVVEVPRLLCFYDQRAELPDPVLRQAKAALNQHYRPQLGEDLVTAGLCLYRDGKDSVAWHGDRHGRSSTQDTHIAIVSFGYARELCSAREAVG